MKWEDAVRDHCRKFGFIFSKNKSISIFLFGLEFVIVISVIPVFSKLDKFSNPITLFVIKNMLFQWIVSYD